MSLRTRNAVPPFPRPAGVLAHVLAHAPARAAALALVTLVLAGPPTAWSLDTPRAGALDQRVRFVEYNADNVVRIRAHYGYQIHIQFSEGESVKHLAIGDEGAWQIGPRAPANHLFVKPKGERATTNMTVVTSKGGRERAYQFHLSAEWPAGAPGPAAAAAAIATKTAAPVGEPYYHVRFRYPEEIRERALEDRKRETVQRRLADALMARRQNRDYWICGSEAIAPDEAFDDGSFTYLRFSGNREIPAIYHVAEDRSEAVVNVHVEGDWHIVQRVSKNMVLRKGSAVACIVNKSFDPVGVRHASGTRSPEVERVLVGAP